MSNKARIDWYRTPIDRQQLIQLTQKENVRPLIHIIVQLSFHTLTGIGVYLAWKHLSWPFWIFLIYIHCLFFDFLTPAAAVHELSHRTVFKTRWLNEFFIVICAFLTWTNYVKFRVSHTGQHHQYTLHDELDEEVVMPIIIRPIDLFCFLLIPLYSLQSMAGIFDLIDEHMRHCFKLLKGQREEHLFPDSNPKLRQQLFNWSRIVVIGHLILAAVFIYYDVWILLFVVTFARFIAPGLGLLCTYPQHIGLPANVPDFRLCCRTMVLGKILSFFYWNMNYHTEHHMYAAVPYYNLPRLHELIKDDLPPVKKGLLNNWKDIVPVVRQQLKDPHYCLVQDVPHPYYGDKDTLSKEEIEQMDDIVDAKESDINDKTHGDVL